MELLSLECFVTLGDITLGEWIWIGEKFIDLFVVWLICARALADFISFALSVKDIVMGVFYFVENDAFEKSIVS